MKLSIIIMIVLSLVILISTQSYAAEINGKSQLDALLQEVKIAGKDIECSIKKPKDELNVLLQVFGLAETEDKVPKLTLAQLKAILDTVGLVYGTQAPRVTYLYVPQWDGRWYMSGSGLHAEERMLNDRNYKLNTAHQLWLSNSPCSGKCAPLLIDRFRNLPKPTIYAAHFYQGGRSNAQRDRALYCLALMIKDGFPLMPWNWTLFRNMLTTPQCVQAINFAQGNRNFQIGEGRTRDRFNEAYQLSRDHDMNYLQHKCNGLLV